MPDVQTALSPLAPSLGQVMPAKALTTPDGWQPFSAHLDLLPVEDAAQAGLAEDGTAAADAAVNVPDVLIGALPAGTAAPHPDGGAPEQRDVPATPPSGGIKRRTPDQILQVDGGLPQRPDAGGEARADGLAASPGRSAPEGGRDGKMMIAQQSVPDATPVHAALRKAQPVADPKTMVPPKAEQAEKAPREVPAVDRVGATRASGPATVVAEPKLAPNPAPATQPPDPAPTIRASSSASGGTAQPAKLPEGMEQIAASGLAATQAQSTLRPAPTPPKRDVPSARADAGDRRAPPEAQMEFDTRSNTAARVPAVAARPDADEVARGGFSQTLEIKEMQGKSSAMTAESEISGLAVSTPTAVARGAPGYLQTAAPDIPRQIAVQLADAMPQAQGRDVEISLNPQELGRVRISLNANDAGVNMAITAERGETLDLMRRHIDQLAQEFHDMGYGDVSFSFGQSGKGQDQGDPQTVAGQVAAPDQQGMPLDPAAPPRPIAAASGLDLRI
ncbi:flagellar hook-length control protein FliK [Sediminimonas qiaohouensis]|uniref:flagellar hook-length control protein FliK n=1 Tax=Sediminimonas qiaohouensis TaxID=552061 RepID=UPI0003FCC0E2|nr:flagellar hook-length control protein FliK [Sediminimonas qiaohouensis]